MTFYAHDGTRIDVDLWSALREHTDYHRVGWDQVGSVVISTVWLGIDHRFGPGDPILFETMVFNSGPDDIDNPCHRYTTLEEAEDGHKLTVHNVEHGEPYWFQQGEENE